MSHSREEPPPRTPEEIIAGAEAVPRGDLTPPWEDNGVPAWPGDAGPEPPHAPREEPVRDALLTLRVTPSVHILVNSSYQLAVWVKGGQAVINPAVLFDAVTFASQWIDSHQPQTGDPS